VVWDAETGAVIRRLRGPFPVAARGSLVAWLTSHPRSLHLTDVRTGRDGRVAPRPGYRFESTYEGAFSADGRRLALPVRAGDEQAMAVVDVAARRATMVPGTRARAGWVAIAWAPDGDLYFAAPGGRLGRLRAGDDRARTVPVRVAGTVVDMAIPRGERVRARAPARRAGSPRRRAPRARAAPPAR
jgi:hypothetical protein